MAISVPMDVDLEAILAAKTAQYKSTDVQKDVELQYDLGNILATDLNPLDAQALKYDAVSRSSIGWYEYPTAVIQEQKR